MPTAQGADLSGNALASVSGLARNEELSWLKLSGNKLTTLAELRPLRKLRTLNAGDNELTSLEGVGALTTLRALVLNDNRIAEVKGLAELTELDALVLSRNRIMEVGPAAFKTLGNLTKLSLAHNRLRTLGRCLRRLLNLQELRVSHNLLTELPEELSQLQNLRIVDVGHNELRASPVPLLKQLSALRHLTLKGNPCANSTTYREQTLDGLPLVTHLDNNAVEGRARKKIKVAKGDRRPFKLAAPLKGTIYAKPKAAGEGGAKEEEGAAERTGRKAAKKDREQSENKKAHAVETPEERAARKAAKVQRRAKRAVEAKARWEEHNKAAVRAVDGDGDAGAKAGAATGAARSAAGEDGSVGDDDAVAAEAARSGVVSLNEAPRAAAKSAAALQLTLGATVGRGGSNAWDDEPMVRAKAPKAAAASTPAAAGADAASRKVERKAERKRKPAAAEPAQPNASLQKALQGSRWKLKKPTVVP